MILITGPSGNVGAELVALLDQHPGVPRRIASRHPVPHRADHARLDFADRTTWTNALSGVDTLFLLFPLPGNKAARERIIPFVEAAARAGCRHVVYVSVFGADRLTFLPHHKVEKAIQASGMTWTVLRCSFFMQNLHRAVSTHGIDIVEHGELFVPAGKGRTTFLDARDASAVALDALLHPDRHRDTVHHLTGGQALGMSDVAAELGVALGRTIRYTRPGLIRFTIRLRRRGVGWDSIGFMAAVYTATRLGLNQPATDEVRTLLGEEPTPLRRFLDDSAWRWRDRRWT
ncbi:NmrA family transcriptional regulator [Lentzea pudingi]|uniref:NmrA family transcriptional regulator n=1 Tax=Lentzea pudingi TaxID=1789439 RepID=A0ABQ2HZR1_9PSEU|nr:NmrA family NAD(P)-binding protein [Lentzea pudingi]GGM93594.1 NmrA family transcriptional regulator [Lentzea pudingi]